MKRITLLFLAFLGLAALAQNSTPQESPLTAIETGKLKFEQTCIACHKYERSDSMIAPPAFALQMHYANQYGSDEAAFRQAIVTWVKAPDPQKSLMPGAIQKFKIMPPFPLPDEDLEAIATYLFHADRNGACDMPNRQGQGSGRGMGKRRQANP